MAYYSIKKEKALPPNFENMEVIYQLEAKDNAYMPIGLYADTLI